jgi:hypothetical protein
MLPDWEVRSVTTSADQKLGTLASAIAAAALALGCAADGGGGGVDDASPHGTDSDSDTYPDGTNMCPGEVQSFIWIANTGESTLSKVCTTTAEEVARYRTCPLDDCDPSRTSVNLHGDMVVTNRRPEEGDEISSVTKFAADINSCVDRNDNGRIDTSFGPDDVRDFGADECMLWNTELEGLSGDGYGARATAWDGEEDPDTGSGGNVWVGSCEWGAAVETIIFQIDGDTGEILEDLPVPIDCAYGGAMDGQGNFWVMDIVGSRIWRVEMSMLITEMYPVTCGYGISVDSQGRVWTGGWQWGGDGPGCVHRFYPAFDQHDWIETGAEDRDRGIAVGVEMSAGYVWAATTGGDLLQIDEETMELVERRPIGIPAMVGVAVDYEGYIWTVSQGGHTAHKVNPLTWEVVDVPIGIKPYTYSDMTGMQLRVVADPE